LLFIESTRYKAIARRLVDSSSIKEPNESWSGPEKIPFTP
jgi:hypothetical protein